MPEMHGSRRDPCAGGRAHRDRPVRSKRKRLKRRFVRLMKVFTKSMKILVRRFIERLMRLMRESMERRSYFILQIQRLYPFLRTYGPEV